MQIHELNNFAGTPTSSDYLAIDNSTTTTKIGATGLGVQDKLTVAEANTGTSTASRIVTPKVVHDYVTGEVSDGIDNITTSATETKWANITGNDGSINDVMDYLADNSIVEQGTSGDWTYRKWSNGTAECWLKKSFSVTISTVATSWHRGQINNTSIPSGLFIESPLCFATSNSSTYWVGVNGVSKSVIGNIYIYDVVNGTSTVWLSVYLIGKWK